ncbi:MAG: hypothetical protein PHY02_03155 [Phycisphaerae bacterium]|nr:hypothetical protein [Phycisphaerae bacterium]
MRKHTGSMPKAYGKINIRTEGSTSRLVNKKCKRCEVWEKCEKERGGDIKFEWV